MIVAAGPGNRKRGIPAEKVFTVANGVDLSLADIPADQEVVKALEAKLGFRLGQKKVPVSIGRSRQAGRRFWLNIPKDTSARQEFLLIAAVLCSRMTDPYFSVPRRGVLFIFVRGVLRWQQKTAWQFWPR